MKRILVLAAVGTAALVWVATASATAYAPDAARSAGRLSREQREERAFLRTAAATARYETEACKLALVRSQNAAVRTWAQDLLRRQDADNAELLHLLHGRAMALPMLENDQRRQLSRLGKLSGTKFDREFMATVALRQRAKLQYYEKAQLAAADPALKDWIERRLAPLREQAAVAERMGPDARTGVASARGLRPSLVSGSSSR
jgi:predicted outer membrane protein